MRKFSFLLLPFVAILMTGCWGYNGAVYPNYAQEQTRVHIDLNSNNFRVVGIATGESEIKSVFGITRKSRLESWCKSSALSKMYENAQLKGSQKIIDVNCFASVRHTPFVWITYAKATGVIIEFLEPGSVAAPAVAQPVVTSAPQPVAENTPKSTEPQVSTSKQQTGVVNFADNMFKKIALAMYDKNKDQLLKRPEAEEVKAMACNNCGISDFTGIEYFVNLETLSIAGNKCAVIDLTNNKQLKSIKVASPALKKVIVDKNCTATIDVDESFVERR
ncbi:MAG: DUF6567 family protein [Paludibacteraceae bacterium]